MEFAWSEEQNALRARVADFLAVNLPVNWEAIASQSPGSEAVTAFSREFCPKLAAAGLLVPHWPEQFGGKGLARSAGSLEQRAHARVDLPAQRLPHQRSKLLTVAATSLELLQVAQCIVAHAELFERALGIEPGRQRVERLAMQRAARASRLQLADAVGVVDDLPVQIVEAHTIVVDDADRAVPAQVVQVGVVSSVGDQPRPALRLGRVLRSVRARSNP